MMGKLDGQDRLFYEFRLNDHVPVDHLLRRIDAVLDFGFVRERLAGSYSAMGRPSVDPELMMRMLVVGYLFGIRSERRLCEEVHLNLAYRWYCRLDLDGRVPDHSTFSKNRYGRFRDGELHRLLFDEVVVRCVEAGLVIGHDTAVDASMVEADANYEHKLPGSDAPAILRAQDSSSRAVREYLAALDAALPTPPDEPEPSTPKHVSPIDPQSAWSSKHGRARFGYATNYMIDTETGCILDVEASPARFAAEVATTQVMVERVDQRLGITPKRIAADKAYGSGLLLAWLFDRNIVPHIPVIDRQRQIQGIFSRDDFTYDPWNDSFSCPGGKLLTYCGDDPQRRVHYYRPKGGDCKACPVREQCTRGTRRTLTRSFDQEARDRAQSLAQTEDYARSRRLRKRIERLFGHLKRTMGIRRLKLKGLSGAAEEFLMAAAAQNLRLLTKPATMAG